MTDREARQPDLPARLLDRRRRSPTSPAAASAWTWSRPTSRRSAARSTSRAGRARARRVRIKIPLTLAIIPALIGHDRRRALRHPAGQPAGAGPPRRTSRRDSGIERIHGAPVYRLRGNLLPLVYLDQRARTSTRHAATDDAVNIVVLQADDRQFGLVVDAIHDTEEIVVKPLRQAAQGHQRLRRRDDHGRRPRRADPRRARASPSAPAWSREVTARVDGQRRHRACAA